jgi:hypothetical protein
MGNKRNFSVENWLGKTLLTFRNTGDRNIYKYINSDTPHSSQRPLLENTQHSQKQRSMPPAGFEPAIPASKQPQTHVSESAANGNIHSFCILSDDRFKASSKTIPTHSAILSFLLQMTVSSPVLKVIQ